MAKIENWKSPKIFWIYIDKLVLKKLSFFLDQKVKKKRNKNAHLPRKGTKSTAYFMLNNYKEEEKKGNKTVCWYERSLSFLFVVKRASFDFIPHSPLLLNVFSLKVGIWCLILWRFYLIFWGFLKDTWSLFQWQNFAELDRVWIQKNTFCKQKFGVMFTFLLVFGSNWQGLDLL